MYGLPIGGGGIGRYVASLVNHLQAIDHENTYVIFLQKENFHDFVVTQANFSKQLIDIIPYSWAEQFQFPKAIALSRVQVMHYPHGHAPVWSSVPFVVTLHDETIARGLQNMARRYALEHAVHGARHIMTSTHETKQNILNHFRVKPQKISVIADEFDQPISCAKQTHATYMTHAIPRL